MELNFVSVLVGVAIAVCSFLVKEALVQIVVGYKFRQRLVTDFKSGIDGYKLKDLDELQERINNGSASFIWMGSDIEWADIYENAHHLKPQEVPLCVDYYDTVSRIPEIRNEYNAAIRNIVVDETHRESHKALAQSCIVDLTKHYQTIRKLGIQCLIELGLNHNFLDIKVESYKKELKAISEPEGSV